MLSKSFTAAMLLTACPSAILLASCRNGTSGVNNTDTALTCSSKPELSTRNDATPVPFNAQQYSIMVEFFSSSQECDLKKPFDKWTVVELPDKSLSFTVVYAASNDGCRGAFYYVYNDGESVDMIVSYAPPMKFSFWTASAEGGTIGLTARAGDSCTSYWTYDVNADKEPHYVFANVCNGKVESAESTAETALDPGVAMQTVSKFSVYYEPVEGWQPIPSAFLAK